MDKYFNLSKVVAWLGCASLVCFLAGCSNAVESAQDTQANADHKILVGIDRAYAPFAWLDENNEVRGIDIDLWRGVAQHQNLDYKFIARDFDVIMQYLDTGKVDAVISCMNWTSARDKLYDFSAPYYYSSSSVVASDYSGIEDKEDLRGKRIAVKEMTMGEAWAKRYQDEYDFVIESYPTSTEAFMAVHMGLSDFTIVDGPNAQFILNTGMYGGLSIVIDSLIDNDKYNSLHLLVKKGENADVIKNFDAGVKQMRDSGEFAQILKDYLGPDANLD